MNMLSFSVRRSVGILLIVVPVVFTICFTLLQMRFEYPDILRQSTVAILTKFQAGGTALIAVWYVLTLTAILFIPISLMMREVLMTPKHQWLLSMATVFGVTAGLTQTLGFLRWPFLVPQLAAAYYAPETTSAQQAAIVVVFDSFHRYVGMGVGEHLGYLCTSIWSFLIAIVMYRSPQFGRSLSVIGMLLACGVAIGLLEPTGWDTAGTINAISYLGWAVWLIAVGIVVLLRRAPYAEVTSSNTNATYSALNR